ncbi:hypothetical protein ACFE04_025059 [Oxalis oulophora]
MAASNDTPSFLQYLNLILFRPILAITFVFTFITLGWFLAWKLVLVHVPLVQEIFGLRKKPKIQESERWRSDLQNEQTTFLVPRLLVVGADKIAITPSVSQSTFMF